MSLKTQIIFLAINALLIFLLGGFVGYKIKQCPVCNEETIIRYDTIPIKNPVAVLVPVSKPKLIGVKKFKDSKGVEFDTFRNSSQIKKSTTFNDLDCDSSTQEFSSQMKITCLDTTIYTDTSFVKDSYRIVDFDTITQNKLIGKARLFTDLRPQIIKTIEKSIVIKPKAVKAFIGLDTGGNKNQWGIGPSAIVEIKDKFAFHYNYDARNNGHQAGFLIYAFGF